VDWLVPQDRQHMSDTSVITEGASSTQWTKRGVEHALVAEALRAATTAVLWSKSRAPIITVLT